MSPIRKTDDFRSVEIDSWDEYVQDEIAGMQARGEFENLPDQGKPIKIWKTDVNPDYDLAFSRLKNAGVVPLWMELDRDIGRLTEELWTRLDRIEQLLRGMLSQLQTPTDPEPEEPRSWWERFRRWFRIETSANEPPLPTVTTIMATRERERKRFLEVVAELDKKISSYNDSLPKGGENLQRLRWIPSRAEKVFDERIALSDWWEAIDD